MCPGQKCYLDSFIDSSGRSHRSKARRCNALPTFQPFYIRRISYASISLARQGNDWGPQYQAALFPHDEDQRRFAEEAMVWAREKLPLLGGRENIRPRSETKEKLGRSVSGDNACLPNAPAWGVAAGAAINSDSGGLEKRRKKAYGRQSLGVQGTGEGGEKNSPPGTIEALPTWWEGSDIKTLVLPLPEEGFQPEVLRKSSGQA